MNSDLYVEMERDGNQVRINLKGAGAPAVGFPLPPRNPPAIQAQLINELREGDAQPQSVNLLADSVSAWLQDAQLFFTLAVNNAVDPVRLIFSIAAPLRTDAQLAPAFTDLPFELLYLPGQPPLLLNPKVGAFVHLLTKVSAANISLSQHNPPLRVLIVHANPPDLGGAVPDPYPIRDRIIALAQGLGPNTVQVNILSRNPGPDCVGEPTIARFEDRLKTPPSYDILVFLGHGNLDTTRPDIVPQSLLYFESQDGSTVDPITSNALAIALQNHPIPVVLLMGCYTAAQIPNDIRQDVLDAAPQSLRGNQGMAQALVDSSSGVQVALGMRCRLEGQDAGHFLDAFFTNLLETNPGHVEAAIHAGRETLHLHSLFQAAWAAPVLFRTLRDEPMFEFLSSPPAIPIPEGFIVSRNVVWENTKSLSATREYGTIASYKNLLKKLETEMITAVTTRAPLLLPEWTVGAPSSTVTLPLNLHGQLNVTRLQGKLTLDANGVILNRCKPTAALKAAGWKLTQELDDKFLQFTVELAQPGPPALLQGPLMDIEFKLDPTTGIAALLNLTAVETQPKRQLAFGNSAIIVPLE